MKREKVKEEIIKYSPQRRGARREKIKTYVMFYPEFIKRHIKQKIVYLILFYNLISWNFKIILTLLPY